MSRYEVALFDFDGTITDSAQGIRICIEKTLEKMGKPIPDLSDYSKFVGPVLLHTFQKVCGLSETEAKQAVAIYVELYDDYGVKANKLFDGMKDTLARLRENGVKVVVCTCKNELIATDVINHLGVYDSFDEICGSDSKGTRKEKQEIIEYALNKLEVTDRSKVVMIGDTAFDAKGAQSCSVDFIGVTYGYGDVNEMKACAYVGFANTPSAIADLLL